MLITLKDSKTVKLCSLWREDILVNEGRESTLCCLPIRVGDGKIFAVFNTSAIGEIASLVFTKPSRCRHISGNRDSSPASPESTNLCETRRAEGHFRRVLWNRGSP